MTTDSHLLRSFDASLEALTDRFRQMGALVSGNCTTATAAFLGMDDTLALEAVRRDLDIDEAFESLRANCFEILLRFQPVAGDLRLVMAIEHAVGNLERAGDHAKNVARRVISAPGPAPDRPDAEAIEDMARKVATAIGKAVTALVDRSAEQAKQVIAADRRIDVANDAIFDAAMVALRRTPDEAGKHVQRLFVAKALERIGDHATNIAEEVLFLTRGMPPGATRAEHDLG